MDTKYLATFSFISGRNLTLTISEDSYNKIKNVSGENELIRFRSGGYVINMKKVEFIFLEKIETPKQ